MSTPAAEDNSGRTAEEVIAAYVSWTRTRDQSCEWAWAAVHDGIWFTEDSRDMLDLVMEIINRLSDEPELLESLGAGPLEDLLGGHDEIMNRVAAEAVRNRPLRIALSCVHGVERSDPGYEVLREIVATGGI